MTSKKFIVIFLLILLILSIFNFSSVHAENITENVNVTSSSSERMKADIDFFKQVLKNHNINNMDELKSFLGSDDVTSIQYFYLNDAVSSAYNIEYAFFYYNIDNISIHENYDYYGVRQNAFDLRYTYGLRFHPSGDDYLTSFVNPSDLTFTAPFCWFRVRSADLFSKDSSEIVSNALGNVNNSVNNVNKSVEDVNNSVGNVNNSINNLSDKITEDNSSQDGINLSSHNDEMNNASDTIKNSTLYSKFNNIIDKMVEAFSYDDDEPLILFLDFNGKSVVLTSDQISYFLKNNNLGFVVLLWQSILWFSFFYTMFIFIRKLYKAFSGGNPVDDVSSTLSQEDNKIVGGF